MCVIVVRSLVHQSRSHGLAPCAKQLMQSTKPNVFYAGFLGRMEKVEKENTQSCHHQYSGSLGRVGDQWMASMVIGLVLNAGMLTLE
jgi:hypothetical protein